MKKIDFLNINGDCLQVMPQLPKNSFGFVLADTPYGQTDAAWDSILDLDLMWKNLERVAEPDSAICLFAKQPYTSMLVASNYKCFKHEWIWFKNRTSNFLNAKVQPLMAHESILVFSFGKCPYLPQKSQGHTPVNFARRKANSSELYGFHNEAINNAGNTDRYPTSVLMFNSVDNCSKDRFHPSQKPIDLLQYLIRTYCPPKKRVLDFTAGSFSTGEACVYERRDFTGIEINLDLCERGEARIKRAMGEPVNMPVKVVDRHLALFD